MRLRKYKKFSEREITFRDDWNIPSRPLKFLGKDIEDVESISNEEDEGIGGYPLEEEDEDNEEELNNINLIEEEDKE